MHKTLAVALATGVLALSGAAVASARPVHFTPLPHWRGPLHAPSARDIQTAKLAWEPVQAAPPFGSNGAGTAVLMTDGTVMIQDNEQSWYKLTPDQFGNYVTGTYTQMASLPSNYGPLYFADAVLPDGRLIIEGGEYNFFKSAETSLGAIYDPVANTWTAVSPPSGWSNIGDGQSAVLANGTLLLGNCCGSTQALLDESTLTWTATGSGKEDANAEEGWSLLPSGGVLTVDVENSKPQQSEIYTPATGAWTNAGNTVVELTEYTEMGPSVLEPNGEVLATGASGANAEYNSKKGTWKALPSFPIVNNEQLDIADGPGELLVDGNVLLATSPGAYNSPSTFFEFNGKKFKQVPGPPNAAQNPSYVYRMLALPNGQTLLTDGSDDVELYLHNGTANSAWAPQITSAPTTVTHGETMSLAGTYLNGYSQAGAYGDDAQAATNYPLVRVTNNSTGHVFYCKTHDFSAMPVASPAVVTTDFDVPAAIETGPSTLQVVTNGIASAPLSVTVD